MKSQMLNIYEFVKKELSFDNSGHNIKHIERVVNNAIKIMASEGGNRKIIITACLLHDLVDTKLFSNIDFQINKIINLLNELNYHEEEINEIIEIINAVSYSKGNTFDTPNLNLKIVRDADRLDALGAIGIIRTIEYGNSKKREFYTEENLDRSLDKVSFKTSTETTLSHFYDKLLKLEGYIHTQTALEIAKKRTSFINDFLNEFYEEIK